MKENNAIESRCLKSEVRAEKRENSTVVRGYAAKFNSLSENLGGFREIIAPGAFDAVLKDDVRALINHDSSLILGRTTAETLRIGVDETGLWYEYDSPDTTYARDLLVSMERGDVDQSSFQFGVEKDEWRDSGEGYLKRTITKVSRLLDVSPVTYPAYKSTTVSKRALDEVEKMNAPALPDNTWQIESEARQRKTQILTLNNK
jgi:HK97 family phage prohead protease